MAALDSNDVANPATSQIHLLALPQELQDAIFAFAYQRSPDTEIVEKGDWATDRRRARDSEKKPTMTKPYPGDQVSKFMISKRYFVSAAKSYVTSEPLRLSGTPTYSDEPFRTNGILAAFARDVVGDYSICLYLKALRSARTFQLKMNTCEMSHAIYEVLPIFKRPVTEEEFDTLPMAALLNSVKGLSSIHVAPIGNASGSMNQTQEATYGANLRVLQSLFTSQVTVSKPAELSWKAGACTKDKTSLYPGSRVNLDATSLQQFVSKGELAARLEEVATGHIRSGPAPPLFEATIFELLDMVLEHGV